MRIFLDNKGVSTLWSQFKAKLAVHADDSNIHVTAEEKAAWSGKAALSDIPTTLPANGGNADTIDGKHYSDFVNYLGEITDVDNILNNPEYGDCSYEGIISSNVATSIGLSSAIATEWSIKCFRATEGSGFQVAVPIYYNSGEPPKYRIAYKNHLSGSYIISWGNWKNFSDGGNADTVDGLHAIDFSQIINYGNTSTDTKSAVGIEGKITAYWCNSWTDYPSDLPDGQGTILAINYKGSGTAGSDYIWTTQIYISATASFANPRIYFRTTKKDSVNAWRDIADGGNAATVGGRSITVTDVDPGAGSALTAGALVFVTEVT